MVEGSASGLPGAAGFTYPAGGKSLHVRGFPAGDGLLSGNRRKKLWERQSLARELMVIGFTGFRTFADAKGNSTRSKKSVVKRRSCFAILTGKGKMLGQRAFLTLK